MEINPDTLLNIIGRQQVEITMLRDQLRAMAGMQEERKSAEVNPSEVAETPQDKSRLDEGTV